MYRGDSGFGDESSAPRMLRPFLIGLSPAVSAHSSASREPTAGIEHSVKTHPIDRALTKRADDLLTPFLVIDLGAVAHNAAAMIAHLGGRAERWRPHIKTVKQSRVLAILLEVGVRHFKCATLDELELLLDTASPDESPGGIDVLWAYPAHDASLRALERRLDARPDRERHTITLLADSVDHLRWLDERLASSGRGHGLGVMLDVDLGMARTGRPPAHWHFLYRSPWRPRHLDVRGLHGYDGHHGWDDRARAHAGYRELAHLARDVVNDAPTRGAPLDLVTSGTHSFDHALAFDFGDEVHHQVSPGTVVLSDLRSEPAARVLGLRQAAYVASRVISAAPGRLTLDAGSKAINPDVPAPGCRILGEPTLHPLTPSEEHLPVECRGDDDAAPGPGALVYLIPAHVCTTVNLHREVVYIDGDRFVGMGRVEASGHSLIVDAENRA